MTKLRKYTKNPAFILGTMFILLLLTEGGREGFIEFLGFVALMAMAGLLVLFTGAFAIFVREVIKRIKNKKMD